LTEKSGKEANHAADNNLAESHSIRLLTPALTGIFVMAIFYTLYFARVFLLPVVIATTLYFLLIPLLRLIKGIRIPEFLGAAIILLLLLGILSFGVTQLYDPVTEWIADAPETVDKVERKVRDLRDSLLRVKRTAEELEKMTRVETKKKPLVIIEKPGLTHMFVTGTRDLIIVAAITFILLYFLLAYGHIFIEKTVNLFRTQKEKNRILQIAGEIERTVSRYLITVTVINSCLGIVMTGAMYLLGMPNPLLWGVMAGLANFIPYIGAMTGVAVVGIIAVLSFESLGHALLVPSVYFTITSIEGQIITPTVLGRSFALNPVVIYIWLIFWGWLWGILGALLAVPILTVFKIFCDHIKPLSHIGEFLEK
jgi:predicted PurR-regulated permease PerM